MISFQKEILDKQRDYAVCWLFNIGLEDSWTTSRFKMRSREENAIVRHMEEILLFLAKESDIVLLRKMPRSHYLEKLGELGFMIPQIFCPQNSDDSKSITELVLEDSELVVALKEYVGTRKICLLPYGVTEKEENLSKVCGIELIGTNAVLSKKANDKLYARNLMKELNLPCPIDRECHSLKEIEDAWNALCVRFHRIVIKRPYGASGQGLYLVDSEEKLQRVINILRRMDGEMGSWLVEGWYEKKTDLNAQLYIHEEGRVELFSIKKQQLDDTVYRGSIFPVRVAETLLHMYQDQLLLVGERLYQQGIRGVVGIDSICTDQGLFPVIEINTRFTLSTYLSALPQMFPDRYIQSVYYRVLLKDELEYEKLEEKLEESGIAFDKNTRQGAILYNRACMDGRIGGMGRLFVLLIAGTESVLTEMREELEKEMGEK